MICPKDGRSCIDDLCVGGECLYTGTLPLGHCANCGALDELSVCGFCEDCVWDMDAEWDYMVTEDWGVEAVRRALEKQAV